MFAHYVKSDEDKQILATDWKNKLLSELKGNKALLESGDKDIEGNSGSESEPSEDNLDEPLLTKILPVPSRPKKSLSPIKKINPNLTTTKDFMEIPIPRKNSLSKESVFPKKAYPIPSPTNKVIIRPIPKLENKPDIVKSKPISPIQKSTILVAMKPEQKIIENKPTGEPTVVMVDAATQTEKIDFQRAKYFY